MIKNPMIGKNFFAGKIFLVLTLVLVFLHTLSFRTIVAGADSVDYDYEYEKKDTAKEQKKFITRLHEDKKKCNLAIENTKILIDRSRNKPYLPEMYLRLAELYIEKSRIVYFLRKAESPSSIRSLEQIESHSLKNQAIEIYHRILNDFPTIEDLDRVHFFLAHEYRELGQIDDMIAHYRAIITKFKDSSLVPEAYLLLGDHFFNSQDLEMAQRHYQAILNYPQSSAIAIARYKLAWCHINRTEFKEAIKLFEESVTSPLNSRELDIDTYKRVDVRIEALTDMAYCYSECYKDSSPQDAVAYFEKYAWSRPVFTLALEKLAYRYLIKNRWSHAAVIYRQLSSLHHDAEKLLEYSHRIFECVKAMDRFEDADQDVGIMIAALKKQKYSIHIPEEEKKKNLVDFELYARDIITHLHLKARAEKSVAGFCQAADSYKTYLEFFETSPARGEMEANYAEALFASQKYLEAGKQYEKLAKAIPEKNRQKEEMFYSAVLSYYNALKHKKDLTYYQTAFARGGLKTCGKDYDAAFPDSKRASKVAFNVAWITYDEGKYDEAIGEFSRFVDLYPKSEEAKASVHLILDAYNLKEDYAGLVKYGRKILKNPQVIDGKVDEEMKTEVEKIVQAAESKIISSFTVAAVNDWEKGREDLVQTAKVNSHSSMGEYALYALVVPSKEKGDLETLFTAGTGLMVNFPSSLKIEDTLNLMIDSSLRIAQFRLLAQYLEEFAARFPKHGNSLAFLIQAAHIRENLGQFDLSWKDYQMIFNSIGKAGKGEISGKNGSNGKSGKGGSSENTGKVNKSQEEIIFSLADTAEKRGDQESCLTVLLAHKDTLSPLGQIKAEARIADFYLQRKAYDQARPFIVKVKKAYKPELAREDVSIKALLARMEYLDLENMFKEYMGLQFKKVLDTSLVTSKTKLLENLEKGYHRVIQYQSPDWVLSSCYRSFEINKEFARFLKESPLPDLTPEEKEQYLGLIDQQVQGYTEKADQYLKTCIDQAHAWEICDPELSRYFLAQSGQQKASSFSNSRSSAELTNQWFQDEVLRGLHRKLLKDPNDASTLLDLAETYRERGDVKLSILIIQKALGDIKDTARELTCRAYNALGVTYLYTGEDRLAKDAFSRALAIDAQHKGALENLAALYRHYGHTEKAQSLYQRLSDRSSLLSSRTNVRDLDKLNE